MTHGNPGRSASGARRHACAAPGRRTLRLIAALLLGLQLAGCYTYVPTSTGAVPPGSVVTVSVTDRGRVGLTEAVGPGVRRIGGSVMSRTDTAVVLAVNTVQHLDLGVPVRWAGESVVIPSDYVAEIREKRFSKGRTAILGAAIVAGAVAASAIAIAGFGGDPDTDKPGGGDPPASIRIPLFMIR